MNKIVVTAATDIRMDDPAARFLDELGRLFPKRMAAAKATLIEFGDEEIEHLTRHILSAAGVEFWPVEESDLTTKGTKSTKEEKKGIGEEKEEMTETPAPVVISEACQAEAVSLEAPAAAVVAETAKTVKAALPGRTCPYCQESYVPRRDGQKCCGKAECKKAFKKAYMAEYWAKHPPAKRAEPITEVISEIDGLPAPHPADLDPSEERPVPPPTGNEYGGTNDSRPWFIEDGPGRGSRMSVSDLRRSLVSGSMKVGQHVRHRDNGRHTVVKTTHGQGQKLERLFGEQAVYVLPGEL
jgi:hypothetical protein